MKSFRLSLLLVVILLLNSCSLMKFSIETPGKPLSSRQLTTRMLVRNFVCEATDKIARSADSIAQLSADNPFFQINAIRWKLNASSAYTRAGYQTVPESSLTDVWVLTRQWNQLMDAQADSLFGDYGALSRETSTQLLADWELLVEKLYSTAEYDKLKRFVSEFSADHPLNAFSTQSPQTLAALLLYLELPDTAYTSTVGTQGEVLSDFADRMGRYQSQLSNGFEWEKDRMQIQWKESGLDEKILARTDSLAHMLDNLATIARESPEMMGIIAVRMREELSPLVSSMNETLLVSLQKLAEQRDSLQVYFDQQRQKLSADAEQLGNSMLVTATDGLVKIIRKVIVYAIILVLVLFGVPFALGYSFGRMRLRNKRSSPQND